EQHACLAGTMQACCSAICQDQHAPASQGGGLLLVGGSCPLLDCRLCGRVYSSRLLPHFPPRCHRLGSTIMASTRLPGTSAAACFSRRSALAPGAAALSWGLPAAILQSSSCQAAGGRTAHWLPPKIRSCVLIFFYGGPSHLD